ncbi:S phase cyclin A-associated protein in the endoplasmic reticulum [Drosophila rhopaloa]|uniref:S phase cyclin A-associated protein in the endoplasmic reticulum N-terminal domain-containing protein n=1 Tax=Drosophila rhopaloa TaxID=1041015 RepID=A0ABM5HBV1_DRORH|nr:S phase cyclin A-associated protein in the endoplasmic reticulum [Drosophila rhopaloa]
MEMREVLSREGREAKNLLVYQFCDETTSSGASGSIGGGGGVAGSDGGAAGSGGVLLNGDCYRKPPMVPMKSPSGTPKNCQSPTSPRLKPSENAGGGSNGPRVRSASTGRDKKSELQARYWALLFGNLQRAVNEIYQTVECYENISSCQEAILVLENYVRDFKALSEWFKVSWDYESRPLQQRPQSLAWEVRKSNPTPRVRTKSLCSPNNSGKSSPALFPGSQSGKTSPCCDHGQISPKKLLRAYDQVPKGAMRLNVRELFAASKRATQGSSQSDNMEGPLDLSGDKSNYVQLNTQYSQTDLEDPHLTLADVREKMRREAEEREAQEKIENSASEEVIIPVDKDNKEEISNKLEVPSLKQPIINEADLNKETALMETALEPTALEMTVASLESMENALLNQQANKEPTPPSTLVKPVAELFKKPQPLNPIAGNTVQNSPLKYSSVLNRPVKKAVPPTGGIIAHKTIATKPSQIKTNPAPQVNGLRRLKTAPPPPKIGGKSGLQPPRPSSKTECYGPPNNVASRLSARSRTMLEINGSTVNTNPSTGARTLSKKTAPSSILSTARRTTMSSRLSSREDIASSTSTLKASNEQLSNSRSTLKEERHSEPKQIQLPTDANDGWLTVKNRRRSSMHWANRFNQPTGYASLPTLALLNEQQKEQEHKDKQKGRGSFASEEKTFGKSNSGQNGAPPAETKAKAKATLTISRPEIKNAKAKVNSFPVQRNTTSQVKKPEKQEKSENTEKSEKQVAPTPSSNNSSIGRTSIIKRQKSDLTGLKMTSLHKEYMRSEKNALRKLQQKEQGNKQGNSSSSSAETVVESNNEDHSKIDIKIQTNCEFSKTIGELYESIARCKLPNGSLKHNACILSACDENEEQNTDDNEEERNEKILVEVQESLERQIRELEQTEIDVDTETDETDCEVQLEEQDDGLELGSGDDSAVFVTMSDDENASLELRYQALLSDMSWNERAEALATLQAYVARHPGRAQELHQKLSSPSRRRSLQETLKKYQAKQAKAQLKRNLLQQEKAAKLQQLFSRVEDVKAAKNQIIEDKRQKMQGRLQRAAENREQYLKQIIEKAHDEEKKLKEINFIKNIEAQNKRLDLLESSKETEGRLQDLEQERQKRVEEKLAKEAAVERRRQALEKERLLKLEKMNETRLEKEQRIGKMQEEKEKQRQALAREKARDREGRLLALQVQQQQTTEELQRKILQKQMESARRHEENIEHIRQRALELTMPTRQADDDRGDQDESDDVLNGNTTSTTNEDCDLSSTLSDVGGIPGHSRSYKKKMKKLKQRMSQNAAEYLESLEPLPAYVKRDSSVPKLLNLVVKGGGAQGLDRNLGNLLRVIPKAQNFDFQAFLYMDALGILANHVISKGLEENSEISRKSVHLAVQLYRNACSVCPQIARHALLGNSITVLFDAINKSFQLPEEKSPQHPVELSTELMLACTEALSSSYVKKNTHPKVPERLPDMINFAVITGLIEILSRRNQKVRESIEDNQSVMLSLLTTLGFLSRFLDVCQPGPADPTRLLSAAKSTELFGTVSMLYGSVMPMGECIPPRTTALAASTFHLYVSLASLDVNTFQEALTVEGPLSLKLLDVMTLILNFSVSNAQWVKNNESTTMLIDLIASLAFFCVNNRRHQDLLISEPFAVIFKNLAKLSAQLNPVIYPFLVTVSFGNPAARELLCKDFDLAFVDEYSKSEVAQRNSVIKLINSRTKDRISSGNNNNPQTHNKGG